MRSKDGAATPREMAYMEVLEALNQAYQGNGLMNLERESETYRKKVRSQLAQIHNRLLDESKLMGQSLEPAE